jgi:hypothetical protein
MNANMYDGVSTAGLVPTIFSDDQQVTIDTMVSDPAQAHKDVTKVNRQETVEKIKLSFKQNQSVLPMVCILLISLLYAVSS